MIEEIARGKSRGDSNSQLLGCECAPYCNTDAVSLIMWGFLPYLVLTLNFPLDVMAVSILLLFVKLQGDAIVSGSISTYHLMSSGRKIHLYSARYFCQWWESNLGRRRSKRMRYPLPRGMWATRHSFEKIESQWTDFSKSPEVPEDLRFLFVQIFLRIKLANLGCGSIHRMAPNGQITELEKIGEL